VFSTDHPAGQDKVKLDVPYEPSSEEIVGIMIEMAGVSREDLVYDLGCGDGRIVITAAQKTGSRGVGIDLDPKRIQESRDNVLKTNVTDRVQFFQQDLFQTDISPATVVMLYLWPEVNLKLRPKLFRELKPGTRVVSHSHTMGTWEPDEKRISSDGHTIHFWVIPANVTGAWTWNIPGTRERYLLTLTQQFQKVSGTLRLGPEEIPIKNVELKGDQIEFGFKRGSGGRMQTLRLTGRVQDDLIEGRIEETAPDSKWRRPWKARRNPSSVKPLDP
jgi:SAM-dependent methyltransferase